MEVEMVLNSGYQEGRELRKSSSSDGQSRYVLEDVCL